MFGSSNGMEKTATVMKSCWKRNLPMDVWSEILSRSPCVRTLVRFRCVSKSWRALIDDPVFAQLHLAQSNNRSGETHLLVVQKTSKGGECVAMCNKDLTNTQSLGIIQIYKPSMDTLPPFPSMDEGDDGVDLWQWNIVSSIDGLIMLADWMSNHRLMLWNPSIRKARRVPPCPEISEEMEAVNLGLGFDPLIQDYKHVILVHTAESVLHSFAVYTVGTDSWKTIEFRDKLVNQRWFPYSCLPDSGPSVCVRGVMYALGELNELVSFDLSSETFESVTVVGYFNLQYCCCTLTTVDAGTSLALVKISSNTGSLWVLQTTWSQRYKFTVSPRYLPVNFDRPSFLCLKKNGELLLDWDTVVTSSNLETHDEKVVLGKTSKRDMAWSYRESLLLLN